MPVAQCISPGDFLQPLESFMAANNARPFPVAVSADGLVAFDSYKTAQQPIAPWVQIPRLTIGPVVPIDAAEQPVLFQERRFLTDVISDWDKTWGAHADSRSSPSKCGKTADSEMDSLWKDVLLDYECDFAGARTKIPPEKVFDASLRLALFRLQRNAYDDMEWTAVLFYKSAYLASGLGHPLAGSMIMELASRARKTISRPDVSYMSPEYRQILWEDFSARTLKLLISGLGLLRTGEPKSLTMALSRGLFLAAADDDFEHMGSFLGGMARLKGDPGRSAMMRLRVAWALVKKREGQRKFSGTDLELLPYYLGRVLEYLESVSYYHKTIDDLKALMEMLGTTPG